MKCLKCEDSVLADEGDSFYKCPLCNRRFRRKTDGSLVERWLGPVSAVLYAVIFDRSPKSRASEISEGLYQSVIPNGKSMFRRFTYDQIQYLIKEIEGELSNPTQNVKDILGCVGSESDLREFLSLVVKQLKDKFRSYSAFKNG